MTEQNNAKILLKVCAKFILAIFVTPVVAIIVHKWLSIIGVNCIDEGLYWTGVALIMVGWFMLHRIIYYVELEGKE